MYSCTARHTGAVALLALFSCAVAAHAQVPPDRPAASRKGSLLVFSNVEIRWDEQGNLIQDTFITLQNDTNGLAYVQTYYVNGDPPLEEDPPERAHPGWNHVDLAFVLTLNQPAYWSADTGKPGPDGIQLPPFWVLDGAFPLGRPAQDGTSDRVMRGCFYAWAVNEDGEEIRWNHLSGSATVVNYLDHTAWTYDAMAFPVVAEVPGGDVTGSPGDLHLDDVEYAAPFAELLLDFQAAGSTAYTYWPEQAFVQSDTDITLHPVGIDLRQDSTGPITTKAQYVVWNENETKFSGLHRCITCWDQALASLYHLPPTGPPSVPNLRREFLQTEHGKARIDGVSADLCNLDFDPDDGLPLGADPRDIVSEDASLLGLAAAWLEIVADFPGTGAAGRNMVGLGAEEASIHFDAPFPPDELAGRRRDDSGPGLASPDGREAVVPGPARDGTSTSTASERGSLLVFPNVEIRWDAQGHLVQDTFITIQNDVNSGPLNVLTYFVNGDPPLDADPPERAHPGWNRLDQTVALTMNNPAYFSALTGEPGPFFHGNVLPFTALDPGSPPGRPAMDGSGERVLRGFIYAWAVNDDGEEIKWNHLSGAATMVDYGRQTAWSYPAHALRVVAPVENGEQTGDPGVLNLDGAEFASGFGSLLLDFQAAGSTAWGDPDLTGSPFPVVSDTDLTLLPLDLDLRPTAVDPVITMASMTIWNENEVRFTGTGRCVACWDQTLLSLYDVPNHFSVDFLGTDHGKARIEGESSPVCEGSLDVSLLGVAVMHLAFDPGSSSPAFGQGGSTLVGVGTQSATVRYLSVGACCLTSGLCDERTEEECDASSGTYRGDGTVCGPSTCPPPPSFLGLYLEPVTFEALPGWDPAWTTLRVYAMFDDPTDQVTIVGGDPDDPLTITTSAPGFVHATAPFGHGDTAPDAFLLDLPGFESLHWDSFVTIGVIADDGTDTTSLIEFDSVGFNGGDTVFIENGGWYDSFPPNGQGLAGPEGRVLIAQITLPHLHCNWVTGTVNIWGTFGGELGTIREATFWYGGELCYGDTDGDWEVGFSDLIAVLSNWGAGGGFADVNCDGTVGFDDLIDVLSNWGPC